MPLFIDVHENMFGVTAAAAAEAAAAVHQEAHGLLADHIYPVIAGQ